MSWDSSVGIATGWMVGVRFPAGARNLYSIASIPTMGPNNPPIQWVPWSLSPGIKWPVSKADNLNLVSMSRIVEVYFHSPIRLHGAVLNELHTGTYFTFYLTIIAYFISLSLKEVSGQRPNTLRCSAASPWTDQDCPILARALIITMKFICRSHQGVFL
jgi:hypothetical protein